MAYQNVISLSDAEASLLTTLAATGKDIFRVSNRPLAHQAVAAKDRMILTARERARPMAGVGAEPGGGRSTASP